MIVTDTGVLTRWASVDADALRENAAALRVLAGVPIMAMVKANGYGHGAETVARAAADGGATWLGVASLDEAVALRQAGITTPILIVGWTPPEAMATARDAGVDITLHDVDGAHAAVAAGGDLHVQIKLDTGMNRLGVRAADDNAVIDVLRMGGATVTGVFTHFASADEDADFTMRQNEDFSRRSAAVRAAFDDVITHAANSAALIAHPATRYDLVRPGIALYGYPPSAAPVRPALSFFARVTRVATLQAGEGVGYGQEWHATEPTPIATVAAGYADGIHRAQGNRGHVLINDVLCPIRGRVSMDQISVDISAAGDVSPGDPVLITGPGLGADAVASAGGTIAYEVLTSISARVPRIAQALP